MTCLVASSESASIATDAERDPLLTRSVIEQLSTSHPPSRSLRLVTASHQPPRYLPIRRVTQRRRLQGPLAGPR